MDHEFKKFLEGSGRGLFESVIPAPRKPLLVRIVGVSALFEPGTFRIQARIHATCSVTAV
jgi:hypothetical protein